MNSAKAILQGWAADHMGLPRPWTLFKRALKDYRENWLQLAKIIGIVAVPVAILSGTVATPTADTTSSAYLSFAQLAMNVAAVYTIIKMVNGKKVGVREAYYTGSSVLIRLMLLSVLLVLMLALATIGLFILGAGTATGSALPPFAVLLIVLLAVALAIPSVVMLVRSGWGIYILFESEKGPIEAIRESRKFTKGKVVVTLSRLVALGFFVLLLMLIPAGVLISLSYVTGWVIWTILLQILANLTILPISSFYLYRYYQRLK